MNKSKFNLIGHKTYTTRFKDPEIVMEIRHEFLMYIITEL